MMKKTGKTLCLSLLFTLVLTFCSCSSTLKGTDALIEQARKELPLAEADTIELQYAGLCTKDDAALIWFISGNEFQEHTYLPMECNIVGKDEYTFERTYKPMDRADDIAVLQWKGGYCFLVNNTDCRTIRITDGNGTRDAVIEKESYPFILYNKLIPSEYLFLDAEGNEIK